MWDWPNEPWVRIHVDYLGPLKGKYYFVIVDAHSKWIEVFPTTTITSTFTVSALRSTFARYGLPKLLVSDNGTQLVSKEIKSFLFKNDIRHVTTAPFHPQSNGAAENCVKLIKNALKKSLLRSPAEDINLILNNFLFDYRNTPHVTTGKSPACLLFGRSLRTRFSLMKKDQDILVDQNKVLGDRVAEMQNKQRRYFNGNIFKVFNVGEEVLVKDYRNVTKPIFRKGIVIEILGKCMYKVRVPDLNVIWRRHANQLIKKNNT